jgi:hypothetical protein
MTKWYIKWKLTDHYWSLPRTERLKVGIETLGMLNADFKAGLLKDWGITTDTGKGYAISEATETQLYEALIKYRPYNAFEVTPVIPFAQHNATLRKLAAAAQKK